MCGICGVINASSENDVDKETLEKMKEVIRHRGPDDHGTYLSGHVGLGFRRLSIIDLKHGHQPMSNEDGTVWIVFNGEIYNHGELRKELISKGHVYKTDCDTESIVHLYEEEGLDAFTKLNGMFALAIWDARKREFYLVRDRLGIKPLYYTSTKNGLIFGSEIKAILEHPDTPRNLNSEGLEEFLTFRYLAGEQTLFRGIFSLLPGHIMGYREGEIKLTKYWDLDEPREYLPENETAILEQLDELLQDSVRMRLMSDVPLGSFCSGGVDSGLTTAYATKHGKHGIDTFSVGLHEPEFDESDYAKMVSERYETRHHTMKIDNMVFSDTLPKIIWYHDEPLNHANSVPIHHISKLARNFVTVVLTGEGSDEIFGGYPRYNIASICGKVHVLPRFFRKSIKSVIALSSMRRLNKLGHFLPESLPQVAVYNSQFNRPAIVEKLLPVELRNMGSEFRYAQVTNPDVTSRTLLARLWRLDLKTYLVSLLGRMDKMTMAASIEARVPFLDHRLVEWGLRVPDPLKIKRLQNKYIVKKLSESFLPRDVIYRSKSGFGLPISDWVMDNKGLGRYLDLFFEPRFGQREFLDVQNVQRLIKEHRAGKADHGEVIWELINLEIWYRTFFENGL